MPDRVAFTAATAVQISCAYEPEFPITELSCGSAGGQATSGSSGRDNDPPVPKSSATATAEKVLRSFNTWAFKREQPSDPKLMLQVISAAVELGAPVPFVLYWGKGPRDKGSNPEDQCLDYLAALTSRVKAVYEHGATIKLIFTDTHAKLNGHSSDAIHRYFDDMKRLADQRGIDTCWLGHLVEAAGNLAIAAPLKLVPAGTLAKLTTSARKWYRGDGTPEQGALAYLRMNLIEQRAVERAFPDAIFITFNGSGLRCLFPKQLPVFYMYSLRRGVSIKPWFFSPEASNCNVSPIRGTFAS